MKPRRTPVILTPKAEPLSSGGTWSDRRARVAGYVMLHRPKATELRTRSTTQSSMRGQTA